MGWNYLSTPKLQLCNRWSLGMDKLISPHTLLGVWLLIHAGILLIFNLKINDQPKW